MIHRRFLRAWTFGIFLLFVPSLLAAEGKLQVAELGECPLERGRVIRDCRFGYRTFGSLNAEKSNAVLFPTWYTGTSEQLQSFIGPDRMVDSSRFFVIAVDAFGNGVSSSPSNSPSQPGPAFPRFTIRDIVRAQHRLLTEVLGLHRLHAVVGLSMGGMQTFEWMVSYPDFLQRAVPLVGSPRLASYDLLLWTSQVRLVEAFAACECSREKLIEIQAALSPLTLQTPDYIVREVPRAHVAGWLARQEKQYRRDYRPHDRAAQAHAMMALDVADRFHGSLEQAAASVSADVLVVVSARDHVVTPGPARAFARLLEAEFLELKSDCGHLAVSCEQERVRAAVRRFLAKPAGSAARISR